MIQVNYTVIIVGTILAFLFSAIYYMLLSKQVASIRAANAGKNGAADSKMTVNKMVIELVRTFVLGLVIAYAVAMLNLLYLEQAVMLAIWLWIGFPVVLLVGSVIHENFAPRLAVIHSIDWLVKLMIFAIILTLWK
jgi:hypothetical protein